MFSADLGVNQVVSYPPATDPPFQKVALLLHGDGTNGAQNNTFLDSSTNNFTITRTGNVAQGTFSPFSLAEGQWSNYFDGSGDSVYAPDSSVIDLSSSEFTIETFVNFSNTTSCYICGQAYISSGAGSYMLWTSGGYIRFYCTTDGTTATRVDLIDSGTYSTNTWNHIAVCRSGNTLSLFVNGSRKATTTFSGTMYNDSNPFYVAAVAGVASYLTGYVSNLRVVKGSSVYDATSSTLTVPTSSLTAITNTSLLTCQSNRFVDNSANNFTITPAGDTKVTALSPFAPSAAYSASTNGGSAYFDGSGDYLSAADNANLRFGTSAFTIQAWVYRNAAGTAHSIVSKGGASTGFTLGITSTNVLRFTDTTTNIDTTTTIPSGTWTHVAAVRTNTSTNGFQLYINGVSSKTATVSTDFNQTDTLYVGADRGAANVMNGYITDLRYVNGTAETITVPTAPLTAVTNTQLLLNCTNAGIIDNAGKNDIETVGNAQISTSVKKYGTGSMYFDGTGDWLYLADRPELQLGTSNFTIEGWLYLGATGAAQGIVSKGTSTTGWLLSVNTSNQIVFTYSSSTITSTGTLSGSTWYHVAVCREGTGSNQTKIYIGGVNDGTGTVSTDFNQTSVMYVGANRTGGSALNGYIDDLRITKGQALYTANFTPPTQAFPNV